MARKRKSNIFQDSKGTEYSVKNDVLKRAIHYLKGTKGKKSKSGVEKSKSCRPRRCAQYMESEAVLYCRQLPSVANELRKALLRQDWNECVHLTLLLCQPGITRYEVAIIRSCLLLLFHHPKSNIELLEKFLRACTGYTLTEDVEKFVKILFSIREEPLPVLHVGKYIRKNTEYRVVDDVNFKDL